jgi:hypothetical protein
MKNLSTILFACAIALPLAACGDDDGGTGTPMVDANTNVIDAATPDAMNLGPIDVDANIAGTLLDRAGRPGISTVLLGCGICGALSDSTVKRNANKTSFSTLATPAAVQADTQLANTQNQAIDGLYGLGTVDAVVNGVTITDAVLKAVLVAGFDMLQINPAGVTAGSGYLNLEVGVTNFGGRTLAEDVVDTSLTLLTRQNILSDAIPQGARTFNATFPYLNDPWPTP